MELYFRALQWAVGSDGGTFSTHRLCQHTSLPTGANCSDSIRNDPKMILDSYVKGLTILFVERGFERLGLDHRTVVDRGFHSDLHKDEPDVFNNNLFRYVMSGSGP